MPRLTLYGLYQYIPDMFDDIQIPEACDKAILVDTIMQEIGDLYPYYQNAPYLKANIRNWFSRMNGQFERMFSAIEAEYSPIENYDRTEEYTDITEAKANASGTNQGTRRDDVSAFNSSTFQPDANTVSTNIANDSQSSSGTFKHSARLHGNIGVTTNQQMIQAELDLRLYDIYLEITRQFEKRFIVQVY